VGEADEGVAVIAIRRDGFVLMCLSAVSDFAYRCSS